MSFGFIVLVSFFRFCYLFQQSEETQKRAQEIVRTIIDSSAKASMSSTSSGSSNISGESFSIEDQIAKMDALKKLQKEQQEQLKSLSSIPGHSSGVHPLIATSTSSTSVSYAEEEEEEEDEEEFTLDTSNPTGLTVGDILSGKVDPESVNVNELLRETKNEENVGRKPIRQKLVLDTTSTENITPPVSFSSSTGSETSSTTSERRSGDAGWKISEEDKKKANKWGINIDKLL